MLRRHPFLGILTFGYLALVAWVTLGPQPLDAAGERTLWRLLRFFGDHSATAWISYNTVEFCANIAMFVPIGLLFVLLFGRRFWWLALLVGVVLTVAIEGAQLSIVGRVSDPRDLLANSLGALLGALIALLATAPAARRMRLAAEVEELRRAELRRAELRRAELRRPEQHRAARVGASR